MRTILRDPSLSRTWGRGQGLVEFALVLPIFLLMLFGLIDGGRLVYQNTVVSQAAREGARVGAVEASWMGKSDPGCGTPGGPGCPANVTALRADILAAANRMVSPFATIDTASLYTSCDPSGGSPTGNWTRTTCASSGTGNVMSVRVVSVYRPMTPIISSILGSITLAGSSSMVIN